MLVNVDIPCIKNIKVFIQKITKDKLRFPNYNQPTRPVTSSFSEFIFIHMTEWGETMPALIKLLILYQNLKRTIFGRRLLQQHQLAISQSKNREDKSLWVHHTNLLLPNIPKIVFGSWPSLPAPPPPQLKALPSSGSDRVKKGNKSIHKIWTPLMMSWWNPYS